MTPNKYRYYCIMRPITLGDLPTGLNVCHVELFFERRYIHEIDRMAWGFVECTTPLTPMEVSEYELVSAPLEVE